MCHSLGFFKAALLTKGLSCQVQYCLSVSLGFCSARPIPLVSHSPQIFSFEVNVSVAIITFASQPKTIMSILSERSQDVTEVITSLDSASYKGLPVPHWVRWTVEGEASTIDRFGGGGAKEGGDQKRGRSLKRGRPYRGEGPGDVAQLAEGLPSTFEALDSNPSTS